MHATDYSVAHMLLGLFANSVQYAIRPNVRSNKQWGRDIIIKTVADAVGPGHSVDLKNYDLIILVDVVQVSKPFHGPSHLVCPCSGHADSRPLYRMLLE